MFKSIIEIIFNIFFKEIGKIFFSFLQKIGNLFFFILFFLKNVIYPPFYFNLLFIQLYRIGFSSLTVIAVTSFFTGAALALQIYEGGSRFNAQNVVPSIVSIGMIRELGPVLAGLILSGRISASLAAEIGTMKVSEQLDALITLSMSPIKYLVVPRVLATTLALPILVFIGNIIGIFGGYFISVYSLNFNSYLYISKTIDFLQLDDIVSSMVKALTFGFILSIIGCYYGFHTKNGAEGVGKSTRKAVVTSSILILAFNYILTQIFFK